MRIGGHEQAEMAVMEDHGCVPHVRYHAGHPAHRLLQDGYAEALRQGRLDRDGGLIVAAVPTRLVTPAKRSHDPLNLQPVKDRLSWLPCPRWLCHMVTHNPPSAAPQQMPQSKASARTIIERGHRRSRIENERFKEAVNAGHMDHIYRHEPRAMQVMLLLLMLAFNLLHVFCKCGL